MSDGTRNSSFARRFVVWLTASEVGRVLVLLATIALFTIADKIWGQGYFLDIRNFRVMLAQGSTIAVASLGMTLLIIAGGIDLSAGTAIALCAAVLAVGLRDHWGPALAVSAALGTGCACGFINGALISSLRVVPFIVTLGTMTIYLGLGKLVLEETTVSPPRDLIPPWLEAFSSSRPPNLLYGFVPNIAPSVILIGALAVGVAMLLHRTVFGRHVFALGSNEATARLCGVRIGLTKVAVYTLAGLFLGLGGLYQFAIVKNGSPNSGMGLELQMIAAVVIGGGSLHGGRGSVVGTLTGAAIMAVIASGCDQVGITNPWQDIIRGSIIIVAVALDQYREKRLSR